MRIDELQSIMREAIEDHLAGMQLDGVAIPLPSIQVDYIDVAA